MGRFCRNISLFILCFTIFTASVCLNATANAETAASVQQQLLSNSDGQSPLYLDEQWAVLPTIMLGRRMIFSPSFIVDANNAVSSPQFLGEKVVYFERHNERLFLMEDVLGGNISKIFNPESIITDFSIVEATSDEIIFDMNNGFRNIVVVGADDATLATVTSSFLKDAEGAADSFSVFQVLSVDSGTNTALMRYEFLLDKSSAYQSKQMEDKTDKWFFGTTPHYAQGKSKSPIYQVLRWDLSKPIKFYISANTPEEYRETIREGFLAWNDALGREAITVSNAPKEAVGGLSFMNMFQWVPDDYTGFAYANLQTHPLTGEVKRANIFFPTSWLNYINDNASYIADNLPLQSGVGLKGFHHQSICQYDHHEFQDFWQQSSVKNMPDSHGDILAKRYIKHVVMHEMGHVLGLQHNFAGSLASQRTFKDDLIALKQIIGGDYAPEPEMFPSSSVMDYLVPIDTILMDRPGTFDRMAIQELYALADGLPKELPLACNNDDLEKVADCSLHDSSMEPIEWYTFRTESAVYAFNDWISKRVGLVGGMEDAPRLMEGYVLQQLSRVVKYLDPIVTVWPLHGQSAEVRRTLVKELFFYYGQDVMFDHQQDPLVKEELRILIKSLERGSLEGSDEEKVVAAKRLQWVEDTLSLIRSPIQNIKEILSKEPLSMEKGQALLTVQK